MEFKQPVRYNSVKIGILSDIHADMYDTVETPAQTLADVLNDTGADYVILAGDVSEDYEKTIRFIEYLTRHSKTRPVWVAGNHELWSRYHPDENTAQILAHYSDLPGFLHNQAMDLPGGWAVVGGCGWYDYSFAGTRFSYDQLEKRFYGEKTWMDSRYVYLGMSDPEFHARQVRALYTELCRHEKQKIIFVTHMVNNPHLVVPHGMPNWKKWEYFNAFLGSWELYRLTQHPSVRYAVCGHVHFRRNIVENERTYYCRCLGSCSEFVKFGGEQDLKSQMRDALEILELA